MNETTTEAQGPKKNNSLMIFFVLLIAIAALAGGYYFLTNNDGSNSATSEIDDLLGLEGEGPVARVDGVEITREQYRQGVEQLVSAYATQGMSIPDEEASMVKEQVLATLVNRQLLLAAATESGITASSADIDREFQSVVESFGGVEALNEALDSAGITEEQLRTDIEGGIMINNYITTQIETSNSTVTDEEIAAYYAQATEATETEAPPLEEVSELIRNQLETEKQQRAIAAELERLRAAANIEILI